MVEAKEDKFQNLTERNSNETLWPCAFEAEEEKASRAPGPQSYVTVQIPLENCLFQANWAETII